MVEFGRVRDGVARRVMGLPDWGRWALTPYPPGHYHSPLHTLANLQDPPNPDALPGVYPNRDDQLLLAGEFASLAPEMPFAESPVDGLRYHLDCTWFAHGDGVALYSMMRRTAPRRYIEIGSGWSSACALDTSERFLDGSVEFTFVDPNPERLRSTLRPTDRVEIIDRPPARFTPEFFSSLSLGAGDILFIDSSHVTKHGSEVNDLFLDVIPSLPAGVVIHVHDIFWPFDYPASWLKRGWAWNETYLLRALLTGNDHLRILWFNSYLGRTAFSEVSPLLPAAWSRDPGSSIWLVTA